MQKTRELRDAAPRGSRGAASEAVHRIERDSKAAQRALVKATKDRQRLEATPREIYLRDATRDGIATCLKLTVLMLLEFVLKEYFGGARMEVRTFIEAFGHLPVTVRTTRTQVHYQFDHNPRDPAQSERLRGACAEVTRRQIQVGPRRLRFEIGPPETG